MSKEMIISVNGREKKIAIVENGQTTEFYIERGEENSGVVGNIYKGRVQRVLPGMQSAFVDIGLERDAFLYVSDFFDEEEEIERIVMEKAKETSPEEAEREATDEIYKKRLRREKQMEDVQDVAEPIAEEDKKSKGRSSRKRKRKRKKRKRQKSRKANVVNAADAAKNLIKKKLKTAKGKMRLKRKRKRKLQKNLLIKAEIKGARKGNPKRKKMLLKEGSKHLK